MSPSITIYQDTLEKRPLAFKYLPVEVKTTRLETGDYCLADDGDWISEKTFNPSFAVERKSKGDFLSSITHERDRFERELERADTFEHRMPVVVEAPWEDFLNKNYYPQVHPSAIKGTVEKWPERYNADFWFAKNRRHASQITYEFLVYRSNRLDD
jgi:ERCC4-type nuclease